jgi:hypothetical protein
MAGKTFNSWGVSYSTVAFFEQTLKTHSEGRLLSAKQRYSISYQTKVRHRAERPVSR